MPRDKDVKRLVRARMEKTGEAYTAARAQVLRKAPAKIVAPAGTSSVPPAVAVPTPPDYAALAGMSDRAIKDKTGCTWERWVYALDRKGAERMSHRDIAALVNATYEIGGWWSQTVAGGYERIKGMRARGQRSDGSYEANKSRTFDVPVTTLFAAWADDSVRRRWLDGATTRVRTVTAFRSMRLDWGEGGIIAVGFIPKGEARSAVALAHTKLPDAETAKRFKQYWSERLAALGDLLAAGNTPS